MRPYVGTGPGVGTSVRTESWTGVFDFPSMVKLAELYKFVNSGWENKLQIIIIVSGTDDR